MSKTIRLALLTCAAYGTFLSTHGQDARAQAQEATNSGQGLEEIVVTARRVQEKLQDVPTAITAISTKDLEEKQILSLEDIGNSVPSLIMAPQIGTPAVPQLSIRGVSNGTLNPEIDSPIGIYVDGVYLGRAVGAQFDLADLQRIEILRGPQGTLFGRNAEAGAINFITQGPSGVLDAHLESTFGDYALKRVKATLDTPEFNGLSARLTVLHTERDGYVKNTTPGITLALPEPFGPQTSTSTLGDDDTTAVLLAVRYVNDALTVDYKFDFTDEITEAMPSQILGFDSTANGGFGRLVFSVQPGLGSTGTFGTNYRNAYPSLTSNDEIVVMGHALTVQYDLADNLSIKSISAYRRDDEKGGLNFNENNLLHDPSFLGGTPGELFCLICSIAKRPQHQTSEELQLIGHEDRFDWIAGLFYYDEVGFQDNITYIVHGFAPIGPNTYSPGPLTAADYVNGSLDFAENEALAGYVHATAHVTDQIDISGGVRYSTDHRAASYWAGPYATPGLQTSLARDFSHTDWEATVTYKVMPDVNLYARIATGYVSGGVFHLVPYDPTTNTTYEAGIKSEWFDRRAQLNLAIFEQDRTNIQITSFSPGKGTFLTNGGNEHTYGVEVEASVQPFTGLTLNGTLGYDHYPALLASSTTVTAPNINASLGAEYATPKFAYDMYGLLRIDAVYNSQYTYEEPPPLVNQALLAAAVIPEQWVVNARLSLMDIPLGVATGNISFWVKNLLDLHNLNYVSNFGLYVPGTFMPPRTYGVTLKADF
ncbi:MAG TPA: TonB-dependent receptor [Alphaproteobacteria bacterium]|nr:TonB-dependent receptor [Alphaproteobacteria bacterium]